MTQSGVESAANLLSRWGFGPGTEITPAGQGSNNQTFLVRDGQRRYVLRISGVGSAARIRAEHRILRRLRQGALSLQASSAGPAGTRAPHFRGSVSHAMSRRRPSSAVSRARSSRLRSAHRPLSRSARRLLTARCSASGPTWVHTELARRTWSSR